MLNRIGNRLLTAAKAPGNAVSLIRCTRRLQSLNINAGPKALADFCFQYPIRPEQVPGELIQLFEIVSTLKPKMTLEIGTWSGGTLFMTCRVAHSDATVISVDLPGGRFGGGYVWPRKFIYPKFAKENQTLHLLRKNSHDPATREHVKSLVGEKPLDFLFIDGDHTYQGVREDFEMYSPFVRKGGVVAFHDIARHPEQTKCEVDRYWNEIKVKYRNLEIVKDPNQGWAGIGVLYI